MSISRTEIVRLSKKYANALYDLANEEKKIKKVSEGIKSISDAINGSDELKSVISSPVVLKDDLNSVMNEICKKLKTDKLVGGFCNTLIENNRMNIFCQIADEFEGIISHANGEVKVKVVSAKKISQAEIDKISKSIKGAIDKKPIITSIVDDEIIGGLIVNIGSKMIDASVKGRLDKMHTSLKKYSL